MHYSSTEFSKNASIPTVVATDPYYQQTMGQGKGPSFLDVLEMNRYYGCDNACTSAKLIVCQNGGYQDPKNCSLCKCPSGFGGQFCDKVQPADNGNCGGVLVATSKWTTSCNFNCIDTCYNKTSVNNYDNTIGDNENNHNNLYFNYSIYNCRNANINVDKDVNDYSGSSNFHHTWSGNNNYKYYCNYNICCNQNNSTRSGKHYCHYNDCCQRRGSELALNVTCNPQVCTYPRVVCCEPYEIGSFNGKFICM
uniref:Peptidase M12A domain-containing protein n=1 Tax=Plectus sambesii TaxID=2011161 RepID=A0A914X780_9BILA